jgi:hypothetical protein
VRRPLSLCLIPAFVLVVAACGANPAPSDDVADAGEKTKAAGTVRFETVSRTSVDIPPAETFEFRSTGVIDYADDRSEYREESSGCRTIVIGEVMYSELPANEGFPAGKRWVDYRGEDDFDSEAAFEQSQQQNADEEGGMTSSIMMFGISEPPVDEWLDYLREDAAPERVGEEDVRGVPTTHYRGEVDVRNRIEADLETEGWKSTNIERYLDQLEETHRVIDVWVDSEGRARRVVTTDATIGADAGWVSTTEYFDFGLETVIQAPPAAEVLPSKEWERITEKQMKAELESDLDAYRLEQDDGVTPLPGAFVPSTASDEDSAESSCFR